MKKRLLITGLIVMSLATFTACSSGDKSEEITAETETTETSSDTETTTVPDTETTITSDAETINASDNEITTIEDTTTETTTKQSEKPIESAAKTEAKAAVTVQEQPAKEAPKLVQAQPSSEAAAAETQTPVAEETHSPTKADAEAFIGSSAASLISAIGSPSSSSYAPSCIGDGEDGELHYNGFVVYTYRENGNEVVDSVE